MRVLLILFLVAICFNSDKLLNRFDVPAGYQRLATDHNRFGSYLQNLPLKPAGTHTMTYKGTIAATDGYTAAVVNLSLGKQNLQQCADAVMRLRGEYLYHQKRYNAIAFNFTNGFRCDFNHYADGYRYQNNKWVLKAKKDYTYSGFLSYMNLVFSYAGTLSLDKELKKVNSADDLQAGDVFIRGGSPGHCFIVLDAARNPGGKKIFLLAQSYMPAQDIQVLQNGSPWFSLDKPSAIPYGELINLRYLKRFVD